MTTGAEVIARLERELREVWNPAPGEPAKARACTMNLVVVAESKALAERYTPIVDEVTSVIPARAMILTLDHDSKTSVLDGDVSAVCGVGENATCSERLRLTASGAFCARAGSAIDALLVPEIPTTLVWLGRVHVEDPVFLAIANEASRVLLDTEYTSLGSLLELARWSRAEPGRPAVADLAWTRIAPWQEMTARFFDDPHLRKHARKIRHLTIRQACDRGARLGSESALFLGWLATRLGWRLQRVGGRPRLVRPEGEAISLELSAVPRPAKVAPAALAGVIVEAEADGVVAKGVIERELASGMTEVGSTADADVLVWRLVADVPTATEQRVRLGNNRGARMLERTLHRPAHDPALAESARFAEEIEEEGLVCT